MGKSPDFSGVMLFDGAPGADAAPCDKKSGNRPKVIDSGGSLGKMNTTG